jgi:hypothetical protein
MGRRLNPRQSRVNGLLAEAAFLFLAAALSFKTKNAAMLDCDGSADRGCAEARRCRPNYYRIDAHDRRFGRGLRPRGDSNPRWRRRLSGIVCMLAGAAAGAALLRFSLTVPLLVCGVIASALTTFRRTDP